MSAPLAERIPADWAPDEHGLPEYVDVRGRPVHLRFSPPVPGTYPRTACGAGIGQWWTGLTSEVTCGDCKQVVVERG